MTDPRLDLVLERVLPVPVEAVWRAWTEPDLLVQWFTPRPWRTTEAVVELHAGGAFRTVMAGPDGESGGGEGCVLEVVPGRRLVWTGGLLPGFRPAEIPAGVPVFTAAIDMEAAPDGGTHYVATVMHRDEEGCRAHDEMGFHQGWGAALDQLVELMS